MNILNDRFWVNRKYREANPADTLATFVERVAAEFQCATSNGFDYQGFAASELLIELGGFLPALTSFDPARQIATKEDRIAFWLNAYNLLAIHAVALLDPLASVRDQKDFFHDYAYKIADNEFSLDVIEHGILRGNAPKYRAFKPVLANDDPRLAHRIEPTDPRIHFALYSACVSSPPLRTYKGHKLSQILDEAAAAYLDRWLSLDLERNHIQMPKMFDWYRKDFGNETSSRAFVLDRVDGQLNEQQASLVSSGILRYADFDWSLNQKTFS